MSSIVMVALLMSEGETMEIEIAEKKKREKYQIKILVKLVALEGESNIQAVFRYIELNLELNTH